MKESQFFRILLFVLVSALGACKDHQSEMDYEDGYVGLVTWENDYQKERSGQVLFTDSWVNNDDINYENYIQEIDLNINGAGNQSLFFRAFFDKSLTNYLQELAPEKDLSYLLQRGSFQFTFSVDEREIYTEDLNSGAGMPSSKNKDLVLSKPLFGPNDIDSWGMFLWKRFYIRNGGRKALTLGKHKLNITIKVYLDGESYKLSDVIATGNVMINVVNNDTQTQPDQDFLSPLLNHPEFNTNKAMMSNPSLQNLKGQINNGYFKDVTSIVILKDNNLVMEEYFDNQNRTTLNNTRSVGKSITGLLVGIAIDKGYIESEDITIGQFFDLRKNENYSLQKANVTIKQLLTMTSKLDGSDNDSKSPGNENNYQETNDWLNAVLNLPMNQEKEGWDYFTGGTMLLSEILNRATPEGLEKFAQKVLFEPLNITNVKWHLTPHLIPYGGGGLELSSLDLAKIGQLYMAEGKYNDVQVVDERWIKKSTMPLVKVNHEIADAYGYLWYQIEMVIASIRQDVFFAAGNGGNHIFLVPGENLVIVITAKAYNTMEGSVQGFEIIEDYIGKSI